MLYMLHVTSDKWHVTRDMWQVPHDMWHVTPEMWLESEHSLYQDRLVFIQLFNICFLVIQAIHHMWMAAPWYESECVF